MKEINVILSCFNCSKCKIEHGPRSQKHPSGDIHYCGKTDEIIPSNVCKDWTPSKSWLVNQIWKAEQSFKEKGVTNG